MSSPRSMEVQDSAQSKAKSYETGMTLATRSDASRSLFVDIETRSEGAMEGVEFTASVSQVAGKLDRWKIPRETRNTNYKSRELE